MTINATQEHLVRMQGKEKNSYISTGARTKPASPAEATTNQTVIFLALRFHLTAFVSLRHRGGKTS